MRSEPSPSATAGTIQDSLQVLDRLHRMEELVAGRTRAASVELYLMDPVERTLRPLPGLPGNGRFPPEILGPFCWRALQGRAPLLLTPWLPPPDTLPSVLHKTGIEVMLLAPLAGKEPLGVLALGSADPQGFGWEQLEALDQVREELVTTLLLYRVKRQALRVRGRLEAVIRCIMTLHDPGQPREFLGGFLKHLTELFMASSTAFFAYDPKTKTLRIQQGHQLSPGHTHMAVLRLGQGIAGAVAESRQPILVNNMLEDPRIVYRGLIDTERIASVLCAPVMRRQEVAGVLMAYSDRIEHFTEEDLELMNALGCLLSYHLFDATLPSRP